MRFLVPWGWAWVAAAVGVALLYLLRRREREHPVSALFLWERIPPDRASRLERMVARFDLLLLLQLLAVVLFAFALADPFLQVPRLAGATAIILDASASMAGRTDEALELARRLVAESSGPWAVVMWADPPRVLVPRTANQAEASALLGGFSPTLGGRSPLGQALALLPGGFTRTVVVTDAPPSDPGVEVVALPPRDNLAIVAFSVRPALDGAGYEALVRVRNDTPRYQDVQVAVHAGPGAVLSSRLLPPESEDLFIFQLGFVHPGLRAELRPADGFPWDNVRYYALEGATTVRVGWVGEEDRYLWAALQAALPAERVAQGPWDLLVAVRTTLSASPDRPLLLVGASSPEAELGQPVAAGPLRGEGSPLLRHVAPEGLRAATVYPAGLPADAVVDLWAGEEPALARWEGAEGRRVLLTLDLTQSNLPMVVDFPILLRNVLAWLLPYRSRSTLVVGEALPLAPGTEVVTPTGRVSEVWVPDRPGLYELVGEGRREVLAVNVPYDESLPGDVAAGAGPTGARAVADLAAWPWVALGALILLVAEWGLALRRGA
ncbi:VWA domain-containing protein [Candidatus Bipolaricaulota bacterium]|nr:VWA domain-containing protein [Candidatus Bipolaricaulota bacterium]